MPCACWPIGGLSDDYVLRLPLAMLFTSKGQLSTSGETVLGALARNMRHLPYDVNVQVADERHLRNAFLLCDHLFREGRIHPGRMGVGLRRAGPAGRDSVWLEICRHR
jgi:hypothetical protein